MHRVVAAVLMIALCSSCAMRGEGKNVASAIDGVAIGLGAFMLYKSSQSPGTEDPSPTDTYPYVPHPS